MNIYVCFLKTYFKLFFHEEYWRLLATKYTLLHVVQYLFGIRDCTIENLNRNLFQVWLHTSQRVQLECQKQTLKRLRGDLFLCVQRGWDVLQWAGNQVSRCFFGHVLYILVWPTKLKGIKESLCSSVCLSLPLFIRLSWLVLKRNISSNFEQSCLWHEDVTWSWLKVTLSSIMAFI